MARGGIVTITADSVILNSGKPVRVYGISILSTATPAVVAFYNGTSATGNPYLHGTGTASKAVMVPDIPAEGMLFPAGLFVDVDANTTSVTVFCEQVQTT